MKREGDMRGERSFADESRDSVRHPPHAAPLKALYTESDLEGVSHLGSRPGEAPFVRGPHASMYTQKPWTIRQYAGYADAADSNLAFRTALAEGAQVYRSPSICRRIGATIRTILPRRPMSAWRESQSTASKT